VFGRAIRDGDHTTIRLWKGTDDPPWDLREMVAVSVDFGAIRVFHRRFPQARRTCQKMFVINGIQNS
jgi:hypothetical protein